MRVVVFVKHVPELEAARGFGPDRRALRDPGDSTLNEVDENAVEAALRLAGPDGEVIALTLGPAAAVDALRRAMAMGATAAVHVTGDAFGGSDVIATARALTAAVRHLEAADPVEVVVAGMAALDGLGSVVPSLVAAELGRPQLTAVSELSALPDGRLEGVRDLAGVTERWRVVPPVVVSVTDVANDARLARMKDILAARSREVEVLDATALGLSADRVGTVGSRTEVVAATRRPPHPGPELVTDDDGEGGRLLAEYLIARDLIGADRG